MRFASIFVCLLLFSSVSLAQEKRDCNELLGNYPYTSDARVCAINEQKKSEDLLKKAYKNTLNAIAQANNPRMTKGLFESEHSAWKKYRDVHCKLDPLILGPVDTTALEWHCAAQMNTCRVEYLEELFFAAKGQGYPDDRKPIVCNRFTSEPPWGAP